jgi:hypothetical protein
MSNCLVGMQPSDLCFLLHRGKIKIKALRIRNAFADCFFNTASTAKHWPAKPHMKLDLTIRESPVGERHYARRRVVSNNLFIQIIVNSHSFYDPVVKGR